MGEEYRKLVKRALAGDKDAQKRIKEIIHLAQRVSEVVEEEGI